MSDPVVVATFYKFVPLSHLADRRNALLHHCQSQGIKGSILLAQEGINGTIAGSRAAIDSVLSYLHTDPLLRDLEHKESWAEAQPFERLKVRLKKEIVTLGVPEANPTQQVGTYVTPQEWNELISNPEVLVVDTRNNYEVDIGSFQGAKNPHTDKFREFPDYVQENLDPSQHKKVALFCTGGIRCEKATSLMLNQGFEEVYHLKGGILKYLEEVSPEESLWEGECFVFDERVTVKHGLEVGDYELCRGCGNPLSLEDKEDERYEEGISCANCFDDLTEEKRLRQENKKRQREFDRKNRSQT